MRFRILIGYMTVLWAGLALWGCSQTVATPAPATDDSGTQIADEVAKEETVAAAVGATLTARAPAEPDQAQQAVDTPTPAPAGETPTVTDVAAEQPAPTNTSPTPLCQVVSAGLNLRSGPGLIYEPPLQTVARNFELIPIGFNSAGFPGTWILVQVPGSNQEGWISAGAQFVNCSVDITTLSFVAAPATPTPTATNTAVPDPPTPTPTPEDFLAIVPPGGGGNEQIAGHLVFPGFRPGEMDPDNLVFRDEFVFRVETYDLATGSTTDGAGIDRVEFQIFDSDGEEVHYQAEQSLAYCAFGGDEPDCGPWVFAEHGYKWPSGQPIRNATYDVRILITPTDSEDANWRFSFRIEGVPTQATTDPVAEIVEIGPNSLSQTVYQALVFHVLAYDPDVGSTDGAGIDYVDLRLIRNGEEVYQRRERNAAYCAFAGGEPDCNIWVFAEHNNEWPGGRSIEAGSYRLQATVRADNGRQKTVESTIQIQP